MRCAAERAGLSRRRFVSGLAYTGGSLLLPWPRRLLGVVPERGMPLGVQSGDVTQDSAVIWAACDQRAQLSVEWSTRERPEGRGGWYRVPGPLARPETGGTAKVRLTGLPPGREIFYRARFVDPHTGKAVSEAITGRLRTAPRDRQDVRFVWSGDTVGQGWGINPDFGGLKIYEAMRRLQPDFFIHCGDLIYADGPLHREVPLPGGGLWRNLVTEDKSKVAETLEEFRGNYRYNLLDGHVRAFNAEVAQYVQWDDHELYNNWYPGRFLDDPRYQERSCSVLALRARQAMLEFTPMTPQPLASARIYRAFQRGPLLDLFLIDMRSYRGPNGENRQRILGPEARILGAKQLAWLQAQLCASRALWKVVASDMPLSLIVPDRSRRGVSFEAVAQGDGPPMGRELEIAELLSALHREEVRNLVFLTADVHYAATHRYEPGRARFAEFRPFYEFVSGPLHAGAFGPERLDPTFGPQVLFQRSPPSQNIPPTAGYLHFGQVRIDGKTGVMTVSHHGAEGQLLHRIDLVPEELA